ncbi:hypothetical protein [Bradyrhizobium sp. 45]|uniref:hypothetical protein n=1 Tax=Bradyrhizobium sp. 45 TaxID=1043587 RepID=UPI001FFA0DCF|nr:hypothetical protein [Bradyrhizobium sp. 45]MCK1307669.1 hypothetical protein [Bradyrhizobium sp. 45]
MTSDSTSFEARKLLERADQAIQESVRLRALNRDIRKKVQIAFAEIEWQISRPNPD